MRLHASIFTGAVIAAASMGGGYYAGAARETAQMSFHAKSEEALRFIPVYMPINIFKAQAELCENRKLIRSSVDMKCYRPERLPRSAQR